MGKSSFFKIFLVTFTLSLIIYILKHNSNSVNHLIKEDI